MHSDASVEATSSIKDPVLPIRAEVNAPRTTSAAGAGAGTAAIFFFAEPPRTSSRTAPRAGVATTVSSIPSPSRSSERLGIIGSAVIQRRPKIRAAAASKSLTLAERRFHGLGYDSTMGPVAVRLVGRTAAAAERDAASLLDRDLLAL